MAGERVAVVGGTGYLGSHVVLQLLKAGYTPVVVARTPEKAEKALPGVQVELRKGDVTDLAGLHRALDGCTYVHSVAALLTQVYTAATPVQEDEAVRTNVEGTMNVLRASYELGVRRVVLTSTCSARYTRGGAVANEGSPPTDMKLVNDPYVRSKVQAEKAATEYSRQTGLKVVHILPGALIGPGDWGPGPLNSGVVERLNGSTNPSIEGAFPVTDVRDAAFAHVRAMEVSPVHDSYLVVAASIPSREWADVVTKNAGIPPIPRFLSPRMAMAFAFMAEMVARARKTAPAFTRNSVRHIAQKQKYDCSRAQTELGVSYIPVETSVRESILWWIDHGMVDHPERLHLAE
jgi:dihydroflavonol-4-reductase